MPPTSNPTIPTTSEFIDQTRVTVAEESPVQNDPALAHLDAIEKRVETLILAKETISGEPTVESLLLQIENERIEGLARLAEYMVRFGEERHNLEAAILELDGELNTNSAWLAVREVLVGTGEQGEKHGLVGQTGTQIVESLQGEDPTSREAISLAAAGQLFAEVTAKDFDLPPYYERYLQRKFRKSTTDVTKYESGIRASLDEKDPISSDAEVFERWILLNTAFSEGLMRRASTGKEIYTGKNGTISLKGDIEYKPAELVSNKLGLEVLDEALIRSIPTELKSLEEEYHQSLENNVTPRPRDADGEVMIRAHASTLGLLSGARMSADKNISIRKFRERALQQAVELGIDVHSFADNEYSFTEGSSHSIAEDVYVRSAMRGMSTSLLVELAEEYYQREVEGMASDPDISKGCFADNLVLLKQYRKELGDEEFDRLLMSVQESVPVTEREGDRRSNVYQEAMNFVNLMSLESPEKVRDSYVGLMTDEIIDAIEKRERKLIWSTLEKGFYDGEVSLLGNHTKFQKYDIGIPNFEQRTTGTHGHSSVEDVRKMVAFHEAQKATLEGLIQMKDVLFKGDWSDKSVILSEGELSLQSMATAIDRYPKDTDGEESERQNEILLEEDKNIRKAMATHHIVRMITKDHNAGYIGSRREAVYNYVDKGIITPFELAYIQKVALIAANHIAEESGEEFSYTEYLVERIPRLGGPENTFKFSNNSLTKESINKSANLVAQQSVPRGYKQITTGNQIDTYNSPLDDSVETLQKLFSEKVHDRVAEAVRFAEWREVSRTGQNALKLPVDTHSLGTDFGNFSYGRDLLPNDYEVLTEKQEQLVFGEAERLMSAFGLSHETRNRVGQIQKDQKRLYHTVQGQENGAMGISEFAPIMTERQKQRVLEIKSIKKFVEEMKNDPGDMNWDNEMLVPSVLRAKIASSSLIPGKYKSALDDVFKGKLWGTKKALNGEDFRLLETRLDTLMKESAEPVLGRAIDILDGLQEDKAVALFRGVVKDLINTENGTVRVPMQGENELRQLRNGRVEPISVEYREVPIHQLSEHELKTLYKVANSIYESTIGLNPYILGAHNSSVTDIFLKAGSRSEIPGDQTTTWKEKRFAADLTNSRDLNGVGRAKIIQKLLLEAYGVNREKLLSLEPPTLKTVPPAVAKMIAPDIESLPQRQTVPVA